MLKAFKWSMGFKTGAEIAEFVRGAEPDDLSEPLCMLLVTHIGRINFNPRSSLWKHALREYLKQKAMLQLPGEPSTYPSRVVSQLRLENHRPVLLDWLRARYVPEKASQPWDWGKSEQRVPQELSVIAKGLGLEEVPWETRADFGSRVLDTLHKSKPEDFDCFWVVQYFGRKRFPRPSKDIKNLRDVLWDHRALQPSFLTRAQYEKVLQGPCRAKTGLRDYMHTWLLERYFWGKSEKLHRLYVNWERYSDETMNEVLEALDGE